MKINLGREEIDWEAYHKDNPTSPSPLSSEDVKDEDKPKRTVFPTLYISDAPPEVGELPDTGTATITYRIIEKSVTDRNGEKTGRLEIEVRSISPNKKGVKAEEGDGAMEADVAIDAFFKEKDEK